MSIVNPPEGGTPADIADYIGGISRELRGMAQKVDLEFLAYLLAMVADETDMTRRRLSDSPGK